MCNSITGLKSLHGGKADHLNVEDFLELLPYNGQEILISVKTLRASGNTPKFVNIEMDDQEWVKAYVESFKVTKVNVQWLSSTNFFKEPNDEMPDEELEGKAIKDLKVFTACSQNPSPEELVRYKLREGDKVMPAKHWAWKPSFN